MRKHSVQYILSFFSGVLVCLASCTPESCFEETESFLEVSFYLYTSPETAKSPDSLTVFGIGRDTNKIYSSARAVIKASLPLNPSADSTSFFIMINGIGDTITFFHYSYLHLISRECGYTFYHNVDADRTTFTRNTIDSISVRNNIITTFDEDNLGIFY